MVVCNCTRPISHQLHNSLKVPYLAALGFSNVQDAAVPWLLAVGVIATSWADGLNVGCVLVVMWWSLTMRTEVDHGCMVALPVVEG